MKFSKYPSIEQFRHVVSAVERQSKYVLDEATGEHVYDISLLSPVLTFTGTVKVHGTNAGVYFTKDGTKNAQKRSSATALGDHFGFPAWLAQEEVSYAFDGLRAELINEYSNELTGNDFVIYGEWCGGNIQKNVAITNLRKMFIIFGVKVINDDPDGVNSYLNTNNYTSLSSKCNDIYDVKEFGTYSVTIDFGNPKLMTNIISDMTIAVETECPVGKYFGRVLGTDNTVGEGIVWTHFQNDGTTLKFKVKGEKHSSFKVKTLAPVDIERLNSITEFVEYAVTTSRLEQAASEVLDVLGDGYEYDRTKLGPFIKWITSDVIKEESDTMAKNDLTMKDVGSFMSKACKEWFFKQEMC